MWMTLAPRFLASTTYWKPTGWRLGHVGALDDDAVGVGQILEESGGPATAEAGPQTGDGGGVSNTGLVLDLDRAQRGEQLLDQVVLFVVQRGAAEAGDAQRPVERPAVVVGVLPGLPRAPRAPGRRSCPSRCRGRAPPSRCRTAAGRAPCCWRRSLVTRLLLAEPLGQSRPREIGLSGSPSIWTTLPSLTNTRCPQPTAQYGHTERATESAVSVRGGQRLGARRTARPRPGPSGSVPVSCR